ncbi:MAG: hypothetical protein IPL53_22710 [Ignavibacteria bacterium]|nr:hypothetical protein [Ignavibacteria bacterium]
MKVHNKKITIIFLGLIFLVIAFIFFKDNRERGLISEGNIIIEKIERFKIQNKRLPQTLTDIGIDVTEEGPLYYDKLDSNIFMLSFGYGVGESISYHSETGKWDDY